MKPVVGTFVVKVVAPEVRPVRLFRVKDPASTDGDPAPRAEMATSSAIFDQRL